MIETIAARKYYGRHSQGVVVLVNGQPYHFTGKRAVTEAREFTRKLHTTKQ